MNSKLDNEKKGLRIDSKAYFYGMIGKWDVVWDYIELNGYVQTKYICLNTGKYRNTSS